MIRYFKFTDGDHYLYLGASSINPSQNSNSMQFNLTEYLSNFKDDENTGFFQLSRKMVSELIPIMPSEFSMLVRQKLKEVQEMSDQDEIFQLSGNLKPLTLIQR